MAREKKDEREINSLTLGNARKRETVCLRKWLLPEGYGRQKWREWSRRRSQWSTGWKGQQGSGWRAFVVRGGADVEGGQTASTEVEHTLMHTYTHTRKPSRGRGWCCVGGVLALSLSASRRLVLKGKHWCVQAGLEEGDLGQKEERRRWRK